MNQEDFLDLIADCPSILAQEGLTGVGGKTTDGCNLAAAVERFTENLDFCLPVCQAATQASQAATLAATQAASNSLSVA